MNKIILDILKTLVYFDRFNHPLTIEEIFAFMPFRYNLITVENALSSLLNDRVVFKTGEFYALQDEPLMADKRIAGHKTAISQLAIAKKIASLLSRFPYVQTVAVSGSLSKFYADENTDIDFFIITSANRLWIARTLMHFFKKLTFIAGKQDWFCMNYYVDENEMGIPEKSLFTAIEIATLLPLQGKDCFTKFMAANSWVNDYFPCYPFSNDAKEIEKGMIRTAIERILNLHFFDSLENRLMKVTDRRWKKKAAKSKNQNGSHSIGMAVSQHFSKPDPKNFQQRILEEHEQRLKQLVDSYNIVNVH